MKAISRARQAGFTLIEVMVVMIILALISGVLFQALEHSYRLQERFGVALFNVQQGQMATDWYRQSVQGLYPDHLDGANIFNGKPQEFSGLSTNPLSDGYGAPTPIAWRLRIQPSANTIELIYADQKQTATIMHWHGKAAKFIYLDDQLTPHDTWPPSLGMFTQLPSQIQVQTPDAIENLNLSGSPMGPSAPALRMRDIMGIPQ